jgi:hypothetical protein
MMGAALLWLIPRSLPRGHSVKNFTGYRQIASDSVPLVFVSNKYQKQFFFTGALFIYQAELRVLK